MYSIDYSVTITFIIFHSPARSIIMPCVNIADIEITEMSARRALTFGLASVLIVLGVVQVVRGFEHSNPIAVLRGLKALASGASAIYAVSNTRERSWEDLGMVTFSVVLLVVSLCGWDDELFMRLVELRGRV
jgi:hypothetical protein